MSAAQAPRGLRLSTEARHMLPWCVALSVAVHVLLLTAMGPPGPRPGGLPHAAGRGGRPIGVRLITEASATGIAAVATASAAPPASDASGVQASAVATGPAYAFVPASANESAGAPPGDAVDGGYVPRPLLSIAPDAITPVVIATSPETADLGRHV